jgi:putative ABC transport system substrate-binding protein
MSWRHETAENCDMFQALHRDDGELLGFVLRLHGGEDTYAYTVTTIFAEQARIPNSGLVLIPDGFLNVHRVKITLLAAQYHLPAVYHWQYFAELGGLVSYGADQRDQFRLVAIYADRILKGEKPSNLPVQAPAKFELVINLKTAKALGLDVPSHIQQLADFVIE